MDSYTMLTRRQVLAVTAASAAALALPRTMLARAKPTSAAQRARFFEAGVIPAIAITIDKAEMDSLRREPRKYVKCQLKVDGKRDYVDVAIHLKGSAGSFRSVDDRPGLTFNMDKFEDAQRFHGMDKWHLNNSVQDGSVLSELLCGELYRSAGAPAAKCSHAVVTLNERNLGFYLLKEGYDKGFLRTAFGDTDGNFYDGGFLRDLDKPLELNIDGKTDVKDQAELKSLFEASREPDKDHRFDLMEQRLEMPDFITYLSMQVLTCDWDGYAMNRNNYRLYYHSETRKITFIPSGMDQMWGDPNWPLFPTFKGMVARHLIETPEGRKRFLARTAELLETVMAPEKLVKRLDALQARIQPAIAALDKDAADEQANHTNRLRDAIRQRAKTIGDRLAKETAVGSSMRASELPFETFEKPRRV